MLDKSHKIGYSYRGKVAQKPNFIIGFIFPLTGKVESCKTRSGVPVVTRCDSPMPQASNFKTCDHTTELKKLTHQLKTNKRRFPSQTPPTPTEEDEAPLL